MIDHPRLSMAALDLVDPTAAISEALLLSSSVEEIEITDPATGDYLGELAESSGADVEAAIRRARGQVEDGRWSQMQVSDRAELLARFAGVLEDKADALAEIGTLESGTPAQFARFLHAQAPIDLLRGIECGSTESGLDAAGYGWHQPLFFAMRTVAGSFARGRTSILIPPTIAPLSTIALLNCLLEADLPKGIVTAVLGTDEVFGAIASDDLDSWADSRPGSPQSGSAPTVVEPGEDDGQLWRTVLLAHSIRPGRLPGVTHLLAPASDLGDYLAGGIEVLNSLVVGDPWDDATEVGPCVTGSATTEEFLSQLASAGASVERATQPRDPRHFVASAIVSGLSSPGEASDNHLCGPVAALIGYPDQATADRWVATEYPAS